MPQSDWFRERAEFSVARDEFTLLQTDAKVFVCFSYTDHPAGK